MNPEVFLEAVAADCNDPAQPMLQKMKDTLRELEPDLDPQGPEFRTGVILLVATFVVGPHVDEIVQFTGYPATVVADIAHQMRKCGLWEDDAVLAGEWFDGETIMNAPFLLHCFVADGRVQAHRTENGEMSYGMIESGKMN